MRLVSGLWPNLCCLINGNVAYMRNTKVRALNIWTLMSSLCQVIRSHRADSKSSDARRTPVWRRRRSDLGLETQLARCRVAALVRSVHVWWSAGSVRASTWRTGAGRHEDRIRHTDTDWSRSRGRVHYSDHVYVKWHPRRPLSLWTIVRQSLSSRRRQTGQIRLSATLILCFYWYYFLVLVYAVTNSMCLQDT